MLVSNAYNQEATYWPSPTQDGWGGRTYGAPTLMQIRFEGSQELFIDQDGNEKLSKAVAFLPSEPEIGGYIILGDYLLVSDPTTLDDSFYIQRVDSTPDLRNLQYEYMVYL